MSVFLVEKTSLWSDIKRILKESNIKNNIEIRAKLHTEKKDINIFKVIALDIGRDYGKNFSDEVMLHCIMPLGDYSRILYANRQNFEITIKFLALTSYSNETSGLIFTERYRGIFLPEMNPNISGTDMDKLDIDTLNLGQMVDVKVQLIDRSTEPLKIKFTSGVFKDVTRKEVIYNVLAGESASILLDGKPCIDAIDIVEPDNKAIAKHILIPDGTEITSLPTYIQTNKGGVYSTSIGTYLQRFNKKRTWFVYPLYNTNRFNEDVDKAIFYAVPENKMPEVENTYIKEGRVLKVIITGDRDYNDNAQNSLLNVGSGFRMADANAFMKKPVEITEKGPIGKRANLMYEATAGEKADGLNFAPITKNSISANPYINYSLISSLKVSSLTITWENGDEDLIYPGMPCKYVFLKNGVRTELKGSILFVHSSYSLRGSIGTGMAYNNKIAVGIVTEEYKAIEGQDNVTNTDLGKF